MHESETFSTGSIDLPEFKSLADSCDHFLGHSTLALQDKAGANLMLIFGNVSHVILSVSVPAGGEADVWHLVFVNWL